MDDILQQFNFEIIYQSEKTNSNANALSRAPEVSCYFMNVEYHKQTNKLLNPIIDESEIEWECFDDSTHTISLKEKELVDWYFQRNICNKYDTSFKDLYAQGDLWNAPKLCNICSEYEEQVLLSYVFSYVNIEQVKKNYQSKLMTQ